jgi:hypothetical protein
VQGCSTHNLWAKWCPWHSVILPTSAFKTRKWLLPLYLAKPRQKAKEIFKTCHPFIYGDMYLVTNSLCKNMIRKMTPKSRLSIASVHKIFLSSAGYFLCCTWYIQNPSTITHMRYSFPLFNFMLPACKPNSVEASHEVGHTCFSVTTPAMFFNSFQLVTLTQHWLWFLKCIQCNGQAILCLVSEKCFAANKPLQSRESQWMKENVNTNS